MPLKCPAHPRYNGSHGKPAVYNQGNRDCATCWAIFLGVSELCMNCGCQYEDDENADYDPRDDDTPCGGD